MAVSGHQKKASRRDAGQDRTENTRGAPIYQKMSLAAVVQISGALTGFFQNALCMVQVVEPVDLCNIEGKRILHGAGPALVPGHMERINIRRTVFS